MSFVLLETLAGANVHKRPYATHLSGLHHTIIQAINQPTNQEIPSIQSSNPTIYLTNLTTKMAIQNNTHADGFEPLSMEELFPPYGSEAALTQTAEHFAKETMSSIYFDLNTHSRFQREANTEDLYSMQVMENLEGITEEFMETEFANYLASIGHLKKNQVKSQSLAPENRFCATITEIGWKLAAICAHTEAFRRAYMEADHRLWECLLQNIHNNSLSIEHYAHCRELDWVKLIKEVPSPIPGLPSAKEAVESALDWEVHHPHHTVLTLDGDLKRTEFNGEYQTHIDESIYDECFPSDPTAKSDVNSTGCALCGSQGPCGCTLQSRAGELVELVEYPGVGTGVRSLTTFNRGDVLDIYVGELRSDTANDTVYPLSQSWDAPKGDHLCYICSHKTGNWTRFLNHSCQPSTNFVVRTIGDRVVTTIEAARYIAPFEELTIDYGSGYWQGGLRECACGHWNCISNPSSESGSPVPEHKVLEGKASKKSTKGKKTNGKAPKASKNKKARVSPY
ncbi:unnamed protein product [Penicillium olsonii]|uniref:SET domain-containing protein n=1 Tax=Penicillium olsonii TaxID=99116 RepID=A0A9W4HM86_PENOL|nr:unnamed protein product [Penicillium olsonii]